MGEHRVSQPAAALSGKRLLILGGGLWQLEYVRRARQLGVETWVTDWSPTAEARDEADHFEPIDLKDRDGTLALAGRARIDGVLTAADIGVPTAAYVARELGLPGNSVEVANLATNKVNMRERCRHAGIAGPWYELVTSGAAARSTVQPDQLPVIVKPVDNCSSRGVRWVGRHADLGEAVDAALEVSRARQALVEQFLVGTEGSIEAIVQDGSAIVLGICDKTKSPLPDRYDLELRYPGAFTGDVQGQLEGLAQRIASAFAIREAILHIEFLVAQETSAVFLIEFAVRGCGSKVMTHLMPVLTGVDVPQVAIRQALGLRSRVEPKRDRHGALHFLIFPPGRVAVVRGVEEARGLPGVIDACIEATPGDRIDPVHDGRSRPGHLLVWGSDRAGVQDVIAAVRRRVRIDYETAFGVAPAAMPT
jgi:biotin carboxylase